MTKKKETLPAPCPPPLESHRPEILRRMGEGESLRSICRTEGFPAASTVRGWVIDEQPFGEQYARAREAQADALFDKLEEVAEEALQADSAVEVAARKLIVDTHKWRLSKIVPSRYGDKVQIAGDPDNPLLIGPAAMTDAQLAAIAAGKKA